jgi:hypothetical protein
MINAGATPLRDELSVVAAPHSAVLAGEWRANEVATCHEGSDVFCGWALYVGR